MQTLTHVLYHLAEEPDLLVPLREEIEANVSADGWTAATLGKMWKLDSILREVLRHHGIGLGMHPDSLAHMLSDFVACSKICILASATMHRVSTKDITLRDGTRIPKGATVSAAAYPLHHDDATLENVGAFDPFRYARMRSETGEDAGLKYQAMTTSAEYIPFGYGPHAWCVHLPLHGTTWCATGSRNTER